MSDELEELREQWLLFVLNEAEKRAPPDQARIETARATVAGHSEATAACLEVEVAMSAWATTLAESAYHLGLEHGRNPGAVLALLTGADDTSPLS